MRDSAWTLVPGASLGSAGSVVIARSAAAAWALRGQDPSSTPVLDWHRLETAGVVIATTAKVEVVDMLGVRPELHVQDLEYITTVHERTPGVPLVIVADADDPAFRDALARASAPSVVVWATHRSAAVMRCALGSACAVCAVLADGELARSAMEPAYAVGPRSLSPSVRGLARFLAEYALTAPSQLLPPGHVRAVDVVTFESRLERVPADPRCACSPLGAVAETATWSDYLVRRFAPIHAQERTAPGGPARVVFRVSSSPVKSDRAAFGVALGSGPDAEVRALAEGIERYCMLRPPVALTSASARDVLGRWPRNVIDASLFPAAAYQLPGFRFSAFDEEEPRAWSRVERLDGVQALVPTSLLGRPPAGSPRLADATSSGYAAHRERRGAIFHAILELVERDALLRAWLSPRSPPSVRGLKLPDGATLYALPGAFGLAVALAVGRRRDGGIRVGSAAAASFDAAARRALAELGIAMLRDVPPLRVDLSDPSVAAKPIDHVAYYDDPRRGHALDGFLGGGGEVDAEELRTRWPDASFDVARSSLLATLRESATDVWFADASRPATFGDWSVVRAISPSLLEMSWGVPYLRIASLGGRAGRPEALTEPHPFG